mmetsp:Transcript_74346/g.177346  ORF Transcript_74346/g.177346 Transcript_74346/m.177346 type:complete len:87 (+) Transcript_74346:2263-2523(+)
MVVSLWAMEMVVMLRPTTVFRESRVACTRRSDSLSKAEVASSSNRICGFLARARAIATRWRWPPDSIPPPDPTKLSKPSGSLIRVS